MLDTFGLTESEKEALLAGGTAFHEEPITLNEHQLVGSCTGTCNTITDRDIKVSSLFARAHVSKYHSTITNVYHVFCQKKSE